jgi:hypothetical protein
VADIALQIVDGDRRALVPALAHHGPRFDQLHFQDRRRRGGFDIPCRDESEAARRAAALVAGVEQRDVQRGCLHLHGLRQPFQHLAKLAAQPGQVAMRRHRVLFGTLRARLGLAQVGPHASQFGILDLQLGVFPGHHLVVVELGQRGDAQRADEGTGYLGVFDPLNHGTPSDFPRVSPKQESECAFFERFALEKRL